MNGWNKYSNFFLKKNKSVSRSNDIEWLRHKVNRTAATSTMQIEFFYSLNSD
jgi:hypothetical protein